LFGGVNNEDDELKFGNILDICYKFEQLIHHPGTIPITSNALISDKSVSNDSQSRVALRAKPRREGT